MEPEGNELHAETDGARAGSTPNIARWVLIIGTLLAIVLLTITWVTGSLSMGERGSEATATDRLADQSGDEGKGTDSIVSDNADQMDDAMAPAVAESGEPTNVKN